MDSHSPGIDMAWSTSASSTANERSSQNSSPSSYALESYVSPSNEHHHPIVRDYTSPISYHLSSQMMETKRSFSLCALSLSNSSEADLSSGYFERRSYRPFRSNEEYLVAMREDLAEWLNTLYSGLELNADNFMAQLETGVTLCRHANSVLNKIRLWRDSGRPSPFKQFRLDELDLQRDVVFRASAQPGTFQSRDNVANFINWCRRIRIHECLLFETEDLVMRKNEKSFVLCLLEVARYGAKFGVLAPTLVQFEQEIDRELAKDEENCSRADCENESVDSGVATPEQQPESLFGEEEPELLLPYGPQPQISNNDLESLHEKVVKLLSKCTCPVQFHLEHLSEGKYRIGDTKTLIFVRILRNHVMVRVGGGWDTLEHYLEKHDPCRCGRLAQRNCLSFSGRAALPNGTNLRTTSHVSVKNEKHDSLSSCGSNNSEQQKVHASNQRSNQRSVNSSPITARKSNQSVGLNRCDSLSSSPSEAASSLASSQNSISSNSSSSNGTISNLKADKNNNNIKNQKRTSVGNCKRRVESRIPKFGKPPSGLSNQSNGLLPSKTRSTSSLSLSPGCSETLKINGSRIPSLLSSPLNRSSNNNLSSSASAPHRDRAIHLSGINNLSLKQKQRSTIELRTPTPPIHQQTNIYSTSSLHRRNLSCENRKSTSTPPPPSSSSTTKIKPFTTINSNNNFRQSLPSSPIVGRKDYNKRSPSVSAVPIEFTKLERQNSSASSLGESSTSSTASSSLSSLTTAVPKSTFRSVSNRGSITSKQIQPKTTALVDVSSWLERNRLTSS